MQRDLRWRLTALLALCAASACHSATAPDHLRADALVTTGAESCPIALQIGTQRYLPRGLNPSLSVVGLHLRVEGTVRHLNTVCQIGPVLDISSAVAMP
jgi:hypothetical protein